MCDARDDLVLADQDAMEREVELLWSFHGQRLHPGIPVERLTDRLTFSQYPPVRLSQCRRCTHVYRNPWENRAALALAYCGGVPNEEALQRLFDAQRTTACQQLARLSAVTGGKARGLEVGTYAGAFLAAARDAGWEFEGVDISECAARFASRQGFRVTCGEIGDVTATASFDVIAIWNTFEQLYDARAAATVARKLLRPGGTLALRVPNGSFYLSWRALLRGPLSGIALRLLGHNNLLSFPYRQGFTEQSLTRLLSDARFEVANVFGDTLAPIADEWTTRYGALEERAVKHMERALQRGWKAPWVEVYARAS